MVYSLWEILGEILPVAGKTLMEYHADTLRQGAPNINSAL